MGANSIEWFVKPVNIPIGERSFRITAGIENTIINISRLCMYLNRFILNLS